MKSHHLMNISSSQIECTIKDSIESLNHISKSCNSRVSSSHIPGPSVCRQTSGIIRLPAKLKFPTQCCSCSSKKNNPDQVLGSVLAKVNRQKRKNYPVTASFNPLHCLFTSLFILLVTKSLCVSCWENPMEGMLDPTVVEIEDILPLDARSYNKMMPPKQRSCEDEDERCSDWINQCSSDEYVIQTCPRACQTCSGDGLSPTSVYFHVTVMTMDSIDESSMTYTTDVFFGQTWKDERLRLPVNMTEEYRLLPVEWLKYIWRPDSFFKNAKSVNFQTMTVPNHYLWLYNNSNILYMVKLTLTMTCAMKFTKYPHDTQHCSMQIESLSHTTNDMIYEWEPEIPLVVDDAIELPQLDLISNVTGDCTQYYSTGNFTCLEIIFTFKRRLGYFIFHTYLPTCIIVIMSWISFWIKPEAIPARVTLGVTSLLTLSTQHHNAQKSLPHVSYTKAIDLFMSTCTAFVFASMMEYAIINWILGEMNSNKLESSYKRQVTDKIIEKLKTPEGSIIKKKKHKPWRSLSAGSVRRRYNGYTKMVSSPSTISQKNGGENFDELFNKKGPENEELLDKKESETDELLDKKESETEELLGNRDEEKTKSPSGSKGSESSSIHMSRSRLRSNSRVRWENGLVSAEEEAEADAEADAEEEAEDEGLQDFSMTASQLNLKKFAAEKYLKAKDKAAIVDRFSRIAFPASFVVLNILYWFEYEVKG